MKLQRSRAYRHGRIEIIPMIDVMFFLLVTFMLASLSMQSLNSITVNLPQGNAENLQHEEPVTLTITGPILGWATNSNVKKGQHSLSATIIFAIIAIHLPSPGTRKAYRCRSSSVPITADLNCARSVAARSRSSALFKQQTTGMS